MGKVVVLRQPELEFFVPDPFSKPLTRPLFLSRVRAGFPSPASDYIERELDLHELLITHPAATFYVRLAGDSLIDIGLFDNDILVVNRALEAQHKQIVVAAVDGEFTVKRLWLENGNIELRPENPLYQPIRIKPEQDFYIWGVVTGSVRKFNL